MARLVGFLVILDLCCAYSIKSNTKSTEVLFLIVSQDNSYHSQLALQLKSDIIRQTKSKGNLIFPHYYIDVHILNEFYQRPGDWTLLLMLSQLTRTPFSASAQTTTDHQKFYIKDSTKWIILCEEQTHISLEILLNQLSKLNHSKPMFLGHALYDKEATIIHHFAFYENPHCFPYPMLRSGLIFTYTLLQRIAATTLHAHKRNMQTSNICSDKSDNNTSSSFRVVGIRTEFSIDAAHELALFIYNNLETNTPASNKNIVAGSKPDSKKDYKDTSKEKIQFKVTEEFMPRDYDNIDVEVYKEVNRTELNVASAYAAAVMKGIILEDVTFICGAKVTKEHWRLSLYNKGIQKTITKTNNVKEQAQTSTSTTTPCAMQAKSMVTCSAVNRAQIYFAIKTCHKFHKERIPIIESTWGPFAIHKKYFSDQTDKNIPTVSVNVSNEEVGHCLKTLQILRLAFEDIELWNNELAKAQPINPHINETELVGEVTNKSTFPKPIQWLVLCDDDTLLSVAGICEVIGCFFKEHNLYLGERYGYRLHAADGFNYITGGGGIVFSLPVVRLILQKCHCPHANDGDDMILGSCLQWLHIKAIHSSRFHQARPNDYATELLQLDAPVSFHKFWQLDPISVYEQWFAAADRKLLHKGRQTKRKKLKIIRNQLERNRFTMPHVAKLLHMEKIHIDL